MIATFEALTPTYRCIWQYLDNHLSIDASVKVMLRLLKLANDSHCEEALGRYLISLIHQSATIDIDHIERRFKGTSIRIPTVACQQHPLAEYDHCIPHSLFSQSGATYYATT